MPSLRDTVAQVEAEWNEGNRDSESDDSDHDDGSDASDAPRKMLPVTPLATAQVAVRGGGPLYVLLIHGTWSSTGWILDAMIGRQLPPEITRGVSKHDQDVNTARVMHAWQDATVHRRNFAHGEDADAIASCQRSVASGEYHAIVLVDLSARDVLPTVEAHLGGLLSAFAHAGGSVAVTSSEGLLLPPTLARLFGTAWEPGAYYRAAWEPNRQNVTRHMHGPGLEPVAPLRAKACCLNGVPPHERLFGAPRGKRPAASIGQRVVCPDSTDTADSTGNTSDDAEEPQDVCVAVHSHGAGRVAFFGDAFCTAPTVELLAAFCRATPCARAGAQPTPHRPSARAAGALQPGRRIVVHGLVARPEHNAKGGTVLRAQGTERWQVRLDDAEGTELALKPTNLALVTEGSEGEGEGEGEGKGDEGGGDESGGGKGGGGEGHGGRSRRVHLPQSTYSPVRVLWAMALGQPPDGRGDVFPVPWMNFVAVTGSSIALGFLVSGLAYTAMAAWMGALQPDDADLTGPDAEWTPDGARFS